MDSTIISEGLRPDLLKLLYKGKIEEVKTKLQAKTSSRLFGFMLKKKRDEEIGFAYTILLACLQNTLVPKSYKEISILDFEKDFLNELNELFRMMLVLKNAPCETEVEQLLSLTILECIRDGAAYIEQQGSQNPQETRSGKVWKNGSEIRWKAHQLADYFKEKVDDKNTLECLFLKAKITNIIMGHYPELVGPDMIAVGVQYEKMGITNEAKRFLRPVVLDFTRLVEEVKACLEDPEVNMAYEDLVSTKSLVQALEGLQRMGEQINGDVLRSAQNILTELHNIPEINKP